MIQYGSIAEIISKEFSYQKDRRVDPSTGEIE